MSFTGEILSMKRASGVHNSNLCIYAGFICSQCLEGKKTLQWQRRLPLKQTKSIQQQIYHYRNNEQGNTKSFCFADWISYLPTSYFAVLVLAIVLRWYQSKVMMTYILKKVLLNYVLHIYNDISFGILKGLFQYHIRIKLSVSTFEMSTFWPLVFKDFSEWREAELDALNCTIWF